MSRWFLPFRKPSPTKQEPPAPAPPGVQILHTLQELDERIDLLRQNLHDFAKFSPLRFGFAYHEDKSQLPADPYSAEYRQVQLELYKTISGRASYEPWQSEPIRILLEQAVDPHPYPFLTKHAQHIGNHFLLLGHTLRLIGQQVPSAKTVLDYGCGSGFTTINLAASGFDVTAVDINAEALKVVDVLAATRKLSVETFNGTFGQVPDETRRYDIVLFYESFHHCLDFVELMRSLPDRLADGGIVLFVCEAVFADFHKPWGLRVDGPALWEIRDKGWLELGFSEAFFLDMLTRTGWQVSKQQFEYTADFYIAKRAPWSVSSCTGSS
jgi:SAM-dependent methyltransferase